MVVIRYSNSGLPHALLLMHDLYVHDIDCSSVHVTLPAAHEPPEVTLLIVKLLWIINYICIIIVIIL